MTKNPKLIPLELEMCSRDVLHWFDWWAWTYNPNLINPDGSTGVAHLPFDLFPKQRDLVRWMDARIAAREDGLVEKSRETGFTYLTGGIALHKWRFRRGFKTAFGSRDRDLVDKVGDPDSIFEKIRIMLQAMPRWMWPPGFNPSIHDNFCRLLNPENGNAIVGEGGDEIGRGGRNSLFIYDEFGFVKNGDRADRSTSANSQCRIFGSTVNTPGDAFARKRHSGTLKPHQIFRLHFKDDPRKDAAWEKKERARLEAHVFAAEYDIDYSASVEGICIPAKYVEAAKALKHELAARGQVLEPDPRGMGGLDVGAGKARSVFVPRLGPIVRPPTSWGDPDTTETAFRALDAAQAVKLVRSNTVECFVRVLRFDEVGVGKGVLSTLSGHKRQGIVTVPVNVGNEPTEMEWPDGKKSNERFFNLKAELWFVMRDRFKSTYEHVLWMRGQDGGIQHRLADLISLPDDAESPDCQAMATELSLVKWFRNEKGLIIMESKKQLASRGIKSPDYADALALTFDPDSTLENWLGAYGR